jgi:hypothetical protein
MHTEPRFHGFPTIKNGGQEGFKKDSEMDADGDVGLGQQPI